MAVISQHKTIDLIPSQPGLLTVTSTNTIVFKASAILDIGAFDFEMPITGTLTSNSVVNFNKKFTFDKTYDKELFNYMA